MAEMKFMGRKATVVIEVDMGKDRTLRVPVGDLMSWLPHDESNAFGELRIPVRDPLYSRLSNSIRDARYAAGP